MDVRAQNTLLKLTEEPPPHVLLVFTAGHRNAFLVTMLSRMVPIAVRPCTAAECEEALVSQHEVRPAEAARAAAACSGNIGRALEWLNSDDVRNLTQNAARLTEAIAGNRQYETLRLLAKYESDRQAAAELLRLLDLQLRDALVMRYAGGQLTGTDAASAKKLSACLTPARTERLHRAVQNAYDALQASVSVKLALAALGGELIS